MGLFAHHVLRATFIKIAYLTLGPRPMFHGRYHPLRRQLNPQASSGKHESQEGTRKAYNGTEPHATGTGLQSGLEFQHGRRHFTANRVIPCTFASQLNIMPEQSPSQAQAKRGSNGLRPLGRLAGGCFRFLGLDLAFHRLQGCSADTPDVLGAVPEVRFPGELSQGSRELIPHATRPGGLERIDQGGDMVCRMDPHQKMDRIGFPVG